MCHYHEFTLSEAKSKLKHPKDLLALAKQKLQHQSRLLQTFSRNCVTQSEKRFERLATMLNALSPRAVLGRGYGLVYDATGHLITHTAKLRSGNKIKIELQDGAKGAVVEE